MQERAIPWTSPTVPGRCLESSTSARRRRRPRISAGVSVLCFKRAAFGSPCGNSFASGTLSRLSSIIRCAVLVSALRGLGLRRRRHRLRELDS